MQMGRFAKLPLIRAGFLAGAAALPITAQAACTLPGIWPNWDIGPDHYYTAANWPVSLGGIARDDRAGFCSSVFAFNYVVDVDGNLDLSGNTSIPWPINLKAYPEGPHVAHINFEYGYNSNPAEWTHKTYEKPFYIDGTKPVITFEKPQNNAVISAAEALIAGDISDDAAKLGGIHITLGVTSGPCWFKHDLFGNNKNASSITGTYCTEGMGANPCDVTISPVLQFPLIYNLNDYVDFSAGQDCAFSIEVNASDRVGNGAPVEGVPAQSQSFTVDQAPPMVKIEDPVALAEGMRWSNADTAVISGTAEDLSEITDIWLTIKDENANRWWDGSAWAAESSNKWFNGSVWVIEPTISVSAIETAGRKAVNWSYTGLTQEMMRSGIFTITAYAKDKFSHVGHAAVSGRNKKKYNLGKQDFTEFSLHMKEVVNVGANHSEENPYTFIAENDASKEGRIRVTAEITPERLSGTLNNYVLWNVLGVNSDSGRPDPPHGGNPSTFLTEIPPIPARPLGRTVALGYTVFPRLEYDFKGDHITYEGAGHAAITQDKKDELRQQYFDMSYNRFPPPTRTELQLIGPSKFIDAGAPAYWDAGIEATVSNLEASTGYTFTVVSSGGSGYRSPKHNQTASEATPKKNSRHAYGRAADCHFVDKNQNGSYSDDWEIIKETLEDTAGVWFLPERVEDDGIHNHGWFHLEIPAH